MLLRYIKLLVHICHILLRRDMFNTAHKVGVNCVCASSWNSSFILYHPLLFQSQYNPSATPPLLQDERDRLRGEVSSLKASNAQSEKRASDLHNTVSELRTELDRLDDENRQRESNAHRMRHESQTASAELNSCKQRIQNLESSLHEAQERLLLASADAGSREQELEQELQHLKDLSREEVCVLLT